MIAHALFFFTELAQTDTSLKLFPNLFFRVDTEI